MKRAATVMTVFCLLLLAACGAPPLDRQLAGAQNELQDARAELNQVERELIEAQTEASDLRIQIATLSTASDALPQAGAEMDLLRTRLAELEAQANALVNQQTDLTGALEAAQAEVVDLRGTIADIREERAQLLDELADRDAQLAVTRERLRRFDGLNLESLNATRLELEAARTRAATLEAANNDLQNVQDNLRRGLNDAEATISNTQTEIAALRAQQSTLEAQLVETRNVIETAPSQERLEATVQASQTAEARAAALEAELSDRPTTADVAALNTQLGTQPTASELEALRESRDVAIRQARILQGQLQTVQARLAALQAGDRTGGATGASAVVIAPDANASTEVQRQLQEAQARIAELEAQLGVSGGQ